ncbi:PREDICTED: mucin-5AC-like [Nanorana parkeri]|uniref:mucin-5AC-like n=1 Tax=Nanorana parkeri TaxID=125878 RepID=UPI000854DBE7|nr:PREDICTED: mucin-5AC-like [Nanorana parkeri]
MSPAVSSSFEPTVAQKTTDDYTMKTLALLSLLALFFRTAHSQNALTCSSCHPTASTCTQKSGYVTCSCISGYAGNGINCTAIASCTTETCCIPGYYWDSRVGYKLCTDINECADATLNKCVPSSTCTNRVGIHLCGSTRSVACPSSTCSYDQDCLNVGGTVQCTDPCLNYQLLNGTSRLSTINSTGVFVTDRYNFGWFRYNGTVGLRMQEGCVGSIKCGSAEPYTLNASHPAIGQGVVMMPLFANSVTGCTAAGTIPVKACAGGYYVYKFSGSLKSEVYCTPTTTTPTTTTPTTTTPTTTTPTTTPPTTTTPTTTTTTPTTTTTTPTTTTPTTTTPTTTTPTTTTTTTPPTTTTTTPTTTTPLPTTTQPQKNITVTTIRSSIVVNVTSTVETLNGADMSYLEVSETSTMYTEVKTISPTTITSNINNSVTPSYTKITVGIGSPVTFTNNPPPQISGNATAVPNQQPFQGMPYFSKPPQTKTLTETFTINDRNVTSTTTTTTITTEEIIVMV